MSDPYLSYGIKWHPGFPGDPGITVGNDGRVVWTAEQERAVQQEEKGGGWGDYDRLPRNGITPRERALALADGGSRARLYTERFPPHDASPYHCTLWEADKADVARNNLPNHFGFSYSRTLVGCAISVLSGVGSKLPLPRYADMRLHIPMNHNDDRPGECCHRCRSSSGQNGSTRTSFPGQRGGWWKSSSCSAGGWRKGLSRRYVCW